jgi:chemotaxis protein MotB
MLHDTDREGMFQLGSAAPSSKFKDMLRRMGPLFARIENSMLIVGHTDAKPFSAPGNHSASNWTLSSDRAAVARAHLMDGGMPERNVLQVVGMAERAPFEATDGFASINRRIELLVLTQGQSAAIAAMFGAPVEQDPLVQGVKTEMPSLDVLSKLRASLVEASQSVPGLQQVMGRAAEKPLAQ